MKRAAAKIGEITAELEYTVSVMFDAAEKYNTVGNMLETIQRDDKEGFEALRWAVVRMANEAAICDGREERYDEAAITTSMKPVELIELRNRAAEAIAIGYGQEIKEKEGDRDLGLEELQKKTGKRARGRGLFTRRSI